MDGSRLKVLVIGLLVCAALAKVAGAEFQRDDRAALDQRFLEQLGELTANCRERQLESAAEYIESWPAERWPDRQTLFIGSGPSAENPISADASDEDWMSRFTELRRNRAEELWGYAKAALEAGDLETAVQTVYEILHADPTDANAARILRAQLDPLSALRSKRVRARHRELKWPANRYFLITTPHFVINTNHTETEGRRLAALLEETYQVWAQVFVRRWTDTVAVRRAFVDRALPSPSSRKHRVILFANREGYIRHLKPREPQIELSKGLYREADQTAYFYAGDQLEPIWRHEIVHQLLAETGKPRKARAKSYAGSNSHAWLVEGVAIYFESLRPVGDHFELGGFESPRLQYARYRLLQENFYLPWDELSQMGRETLKRDPRVRKIYTQAAGLIHFLMDGYEGSRREALVELVCHIYQQPDSEELPHELNGGSPASLQRRYRLFLDVDDDQMRRLQGRHDVASLCLGNTKVTDQGALVLGDLVKLEWLDLTNCDISDRTIEAIPPQTPLKQLTLQGTRISDRCLTHVGRFPTIEELDLSNCAITDDGIELISQLQNLRALWLSGTRITDAAIVHLEQLKQLECLEHRQTAVSGEGRERLRISLPNLRD